MGNIISEVIIYTAMLSFLVYMMDYIRNNKTTKLKKSNRKKGVFLNIMAVKKENIEHDNSQFSRELQKEWDDMVMRLEMQRTQIVTQE